MGSVLPVFPGRVAPGCDASGFQPGFPRMEFATLDVDQPQFQHLNLILCLIHEILSVIFKLTNSFIILICLHCEIMDGKFDNNWGVPPLLDCKSKIAHIIN